MRQALGDLDLSDGFQCPIRGASEERNLGSQDASIPFARECLNDASLFGGHRGMGLAANSEFFNLSGVPAAGVNVQRLDAEGKLAVPHNADRFPDPVTNSRGERSPHHRLWFPAVDRYQFKGHVCRFHTDLDRRFDSRVAIGES